MKRTQIKTLLLTALAMLTVGCVKQPDASKVSFDSSLPQVQNLKSLSEMTQIGLEWSPIYNETIIGYNIYRAEENEEQLQRIVSIKDRYASHYVDKKLKPATTYTYKVSSIGKNKMESIPSLAINVSTLKRPEVIPFVQAITDLPNRIKIVWRPHPHTSVASYVIERKKPTEKKWSHKAEVKGRLSAEYIDKDLSNNRAYEYRVMAKTNEGILSEASYVVGGVTKPLPQEVKDLKATTNEPKKIILTWSPSEDKEIVYYKIYSSPTSMLLFTYLGQTKETKFEDLIDANGKTRYYKVTAVDNDDLESLKQKAPIMGQTLPAPNKPTITHAKYNNHENVIIWNSGRETNVANYDIVKKYDGKEEIINSFLDTTYIDMNVVPNTEYTYIIYAVDSYGLRSSGAKVDISTTSKEE